MAGALADSTNNGRICGAGDLDGSFPNGPVLIVFLRGITEIVVRHQLPRNGIVEFMPKQLHEVPIFRLQDLARHPLVTAKSRGLVARSVCRLPTKQLIAAPDIPAVPAIGALRAVDHKRTAD